MRLYFAYGTLKRGFPNHDVLERAAARTVGTAVTSAPRPLVVPLRPECPNPACRYVHRLPALLDRPGEGTRVEGEVFEIDAATLAHLDRLESYDPEAPERSLYRRRVLTVERAGRRLDCLAYVAAHASGLLAQIADGRAEVVARYTTAMAAPRLKPCCRRDPRHPGSHDSH